MSGRCDQLISKLGLNRLFEHFSSLFSDPAFRFDPNIGCNKTKVNLHPASRTKLWSLEPFTWKNTPSKNTKAHSGFKKIPKSCNSQLLPPPSPLGKQPASQTLFHNWGERKAIQPDGFEPSQSHANQCRWFRESNPVSGDRNPRITFLQARDSTARPSRHIFKMQYLWRNVQFASIRTRHNHESTPKVNSLRQLDFWLGYHPSSIPELEPFCFRRIQKDLEDPRTQRPP